MECYIGICICPSWGIVGELLYCTHISEAIRNLKVVFIFYEMPDFLYLQYLMSIMLFLSCWIEASYSEMCMCLMVPVVTLREVTPLQEVEFLFLFHCPAWLMNRFNLFYAFVVSHILVNDGLDVVAVSWLKAYYINRGCVLQGLWMFLSLPMFMFLRLFWMSWSCENGGSLASSPFLLSSFDSNLTKL